jgi:hypothetical protein
MWHLNIKKMDSKYYFVHYLVNYPERPTEWYPVSEAIEKHPFIWMDENRNRMNESGYFLQAKLVNWQEITHEEYDLYNMLSL